MTDSAREWLEDIYRKCGNTPGADWAKDILGRLGRLDELEEKFDDLQSKFDPDEVSNALSAVKELPDILKSLKNALDS